MSVEVVPDSGKSGQAAVSEKAEGDKRPSEKPLLTLTQAAPKERSPEAPEEQRLTLTLTEEQLRDLAFAVYCHVSGIQDGDEADHPEVVPVIRRLNEVSAMCIELEKSASSSTREELATTGKSKSLASGRQS
ncbi:MAG: hypothetical protein Q7T38_06260 [Gallionella sp.]|nr:hypothetical protein [Gallionella sp.]